MKSLVIRLSAAALYVATVLVAMSCGGLPASAADALQVGELVDACRAAKAEFRPLTAADLVDLRAELVDAVARLDRRLKAAGENGEDWRRYLQWSKLSAELAKGKTPDLAVLDLIYGRYTAGHEGLQLMWFADVRESLRRYRDMARRIENPALRTGYERLVDFLGERLAAYAAVPTAEDARLIGQAVRELEEARQAPALVEAIRRSLVRPNLMLEVSGEVISAGIGGPIDETAPVCEVILKTDVYGTGRTMGQVSIELSPDESRGVIEAVFLGDVKTRNVGYHGPVTIFSRGSTSLDARKRLWVDTTGLDSLPATSKAVTRTRITGIQARRGNRMVENVAWKQSARKKCEAECIASRLAERRVNQRIDQQVAEMLAEANTAFTEKFRRPLIERRLFPQRLDFATTTDALRVVSVQADPSQLGAATLPPELPGRVDLALRVHESMINNFAASALSGMTLRDEAFEAFIVELLGELPDQLKADEDEEPWGIAFPNEQPVSVTFAEAGFSVTIRGRRFYKAEESYPGMDVTAEYKIARTEQGFRAVRQGDLLIVPPAGRTGPLSPREVIIRTLLRRRFGKMFPEEMVAEGFAMPGRWDKAGRMVPVEFACQDGWMTVAWRRAPSEQAVAGGPAGF